MQDPGGGNLLRFNLGRRGSGFEKPQVPFYRTLYEGIPSPSDKFRGSWAGVDLSGDFVGSSTENIIKPFSFRVQIRLNLMFALRKFVAGDTSPFFGYRTKRGIVDVFFFSLAQNPDNFHKVSRPASRILLYGRRRVQILFFISFPYRRHYVGAVRFLAKQAPFP